MCINISKISEIKSGLSTILLAESPDKLKPENFLSNDFNYIKHQFDQDKKSVALNSHPKWNYIVWIETEKEQQITKEKLRRSAGDLYTKLKENKHKQIALVDLSGNAEYVLAFA